MRNMQSSQTNDVYTLDLMFMDTPGVIAAYLIPHAHGAVLVESGPGSTVPALIQNLKNYQFRLEDITDVLLTHIHLDHAGAAGWLAQRGARIHVHPAGAPHLLDPDKLLRSAARIYGEGMKLWGEFLPVPEARLSVLENNQTLEVGELRFKALDTPGHADHHLAYQLGDLCFTGDVAGVRLAGPCHLRVPMPPPDFHLEKWRSSVQRLAALKPARLAPTHFSIFENAQEHLSTLLRLLDDTQAWLEALMPTNPSVETIQAEYEKWTRRRSLADGLTQELIDAHEVVNPSWMSSHGILRYWNKFRTAG